MSSRPPPATPTRLVLVGAGHAHLQLLEAWADDPLTDVELTVVVDRDEALYSGMVPGVLAGDHELADIRIAVEPLVRAAGGRLVPTALASVDPEAHVLVLADSSRLRYDLASLNLGSASAGMDVPGVAEHAVPAGATRRLAAAVEALGERPAVVVGAGAAGSEIAAALAATSRRPVMLIEAGPRLLPERPRRVARRLASELEARGVELRIDTEVAGVGEDSVEPADDSSIAAALTVWAAGAAPPPVLDASSLPLDAVGFVRVRPTLQVVGHPDLFAVGSCASVEGHDLPRAGVHAVRQGPVLRRNLEASLTGAELTAYEPQSDFLTLLNLGDGRALGAKWGVVVVGRWVHGLKDRIDRRWVERFRR